VDSLHRVLNVGAGWAAVCRILTLLLVIGAGTLAVGTAVIRRQF